MQINSKKHAPVRTIHSFCWLRTPRTLFSFIAYLSLFKMMEQLRNLYMAHCCTSKCLLNHVTSCCTQSILYSQALLNQHLRKHYKWRPWMTEATGGFGYAATFIMDKSLHCWLPKMCNQSWYHWNEVAPVVGSSSLSD
jgi:hypothetical protein